jgi:adenylate kinase family enzyme
MQRVAIIGCGGAGKSTLARRLGDISGRPVIHLDREHWKPGWVEPSGEEWRARVADFVSGDSWIIDGNYGGTMNERIHRADTVVFLDLSRWRCLYRVLKRRVMYNGRPRPDMTPGCDEKLDPAFLKWIWGYRATRRPGIIQMLRQARADGKRVFVLRSPAAVERFVRAVHGDQN